MEDGIKPPLEVKVVKEDELSKEDRENQEKIYRALSKDYCVCNHRRDKHDSATGRCMSQRTEMHNGKLSINYCHCTGFSSIEQAHLTISNLQT